MFDTTSSMNVHRLTSSSLGVYFRSGRAPLTHVERIAHVPATALPVIHQLWANSSGAQCCGGQVLTTSEQQRPNSDQLRPASAYFLHNLGLSLSSFGQIRPKMAKAGRMCGRVSEVPIAGQSPSGSSGERAISDRIYQINDFWGGTQ